MDFEQVISAGVQVVEAAGAIIMVLGGALAFAVALPRVLRTATRTQAYVGLRRDLGRAILLGLEVLIVADIIRTILVEPTVASVLVLAVIVVIRVVLSFSLEVEMDGVWPWSRWRVDPVASVSADPPAH
ncbi:DUF1622 domain-containing protein [Cryobacterium algoricola]|uniref:DUF1622 domain-containing protein n=1 Tax=Cryobacterium algoricola TaxID=1259183 RepID=A0ABY2IGK6_9MICO|nr:DUF1622 domain-containing protein [Cryobacterium algoricola]TFB90694.1 DUF1622 domain-containing protein [Cryobacterium algoricola]